MTSPSPTGRPSSSSPPSAIPSADAPRRAPGRAVTVVAVGFLLLDAALLAAAGLWTARPALIGWGAAFVLAAGGVVVLRRRHLRSLGEIARARALLHQELRSVKAPGRPEAGP